MTISNSIAYVTIPIVVIALTTGLGIIPAVDVFADSGSDMGQNAAPTLGIDFRGERIIDDGLKINWQSYMVEEFSQTIDTQVFQIDQPIDITLHFALEGGPSHLAHASIMLLNNEKTEQIRFNQNFKGEQTVYVSDPEFFKNVAVKLSEDKNNPDAAFVNFKFQISEFTDTSTLKVTSWNSDIRAATNYFYEAIRVGEPEVVISITTPDGKFIAPLKQTNSGISADKVQCNEGKELMFKTNGAPVCVNPASVAKLLAMGWKQ
jgi:hypothetical protein